MNRIQLQTMRELRNFYIDHMIVQYDGDWDEFWGDHEGLIELERLINN